MKPKNEVEDKVIEGVLIQVGWGSHGEVSHLSLMTFDEAEYRIDPAAAEAHDLGGLLQKPVRLRGRTRGHRVVEVTAVEVFDTSRSSEPQPEPSKEGS